MPGSSFLDEYDGLLVDLDGTLYRGHTPIPGAIDVISGARSRMPVRFVTNNASRTPQQIVDHLTDMGFTASVDEISTSGQAGSRLIADLLQPNESVIVVGTEALAREVEGVGLRPIRTDQGDAAGVIQGHSPDTGWRDLAEACVAIRSGAVWVACNVDSTLPTERGQLPGNGAMVAALRAASGRDPLVAGKPARPLLDQAIQVAGAQHPLVVGDRLDTDIAGAHAVGADAVLVLTGVSTAADLLAADSRSRPRYVVEDLSELSNPAADSMIAAQAGWQIKISDQELHASHRGSAGGPVDLLRTLCAVWWEVGSGRARVHAMDSVTRDALDALGIVSDG